MNQIADMLFVFLTIRSSDGLCVRTNQGLKKKNEETFRCIIRCPGKFLKYQEMETAWVVL